MRIEFTGRQMEVPKQLRQLAERKLQKLSKVLRGITNVHVVLSADKHREIAEVTVHSSRLDLTAEEDSVDFATSLATVMDRLTRQAQRHLGKLRERKRRPAAQATALWAGPLTPAPSAEDGGRRVIRSRRFVAKPMTVDEAALEVERVATGFLVFRDAATERVSVLYKRQDGNLGLIEPEA